MFPDKTVHPETWLIGLDIHLNPHGTTVPLNSKIDLFVYKNWFDTQILKHAYASEDI
jgi:hypothetical protein